MTNREAAQSDSQFRDACQKAGITPNRRQYVKWKGKRGAAFLLAHNTTRAELKARKGRDGLGPLAETDG